MTDWAGGTEVDVRTEGTQDAGTLAPAEDTGINGELLDRLRPFLAESIMVLDRDWTIKANLAPPGGLIGRGLGLGLHTLEDMHPDDAIRIMDLGLKAFSTQPGWQGSKVVRMRNGDGAYRRYEITAINMFDDPIIAGMVVRTRELVQETTDELLDIERTSAIETMAEMLPMGVLMADTAGRIVFVNETACGMLEREPESIKHDGLAPSLEPAGLKLVTEIMSRVSAAPGSEQCTVVLRGARAERVECRFTSEGSGEVACVVVTLQDVTARDAAQRKLEQRANHDTLTGLLNRASLHEILQARLDRGHPTMVAYLDLDGFKAVNDTWGHERGDHLLIAIAKALRGDLSIDSEIARLGGDEFVVVTDAQRYGYEVLGNQLQAAVASVSRNDGLAVTASVGLAVANEGDTSHDVLRRADHAMYAAKSRRPRRS